MEEQIDRAKVSEFFDKERLFFKDNVKQALKNKDYQSAWLSEIWERLYGKLKKKLDDGEFDVDYPHQAGGRNE